MKKNKIIAVILALTALTAVLFAGCGGEVRPDKEYAEKVNAYPMWENDISQAIPQPQVGQRIRDFLNEPSQDGKKKKVAFIGYDGCRADSMPYIFDITDEGKNYSTETAYSGILKLLEDERAGLYLAYAGGHKGTDTEQYTSTGPGWAALSTGVWGNVSGVTDNGIVKNIEHKTFMLEAALGQYNNTVYTSTFGASWSDHFSTTYKDEVEFLREKSDVQKREPQDSDELRAYVKEIAENTSVPMRHEFVPDDNALLEYAVSCVTEGSPNERDITFCLFEGTDHAGHSYGFGTSKEYVKGFRNEDEMAYKVISTIYSRPSFENEDWLIIIVTDHGGINLGHGGQSLEERTTWVLCNQGFDEKYYSKNYNGYKAD